MEARSLVLFCDFMVVALICVGVVEPASTFSNPLPSIDSGSYYAPWVIIVDGFYYYCGSTGGRLFVTKSRTLQNLLQKPKTFIYVPPADKNYSSNLLAPELHYRKGRWYVYFAANDGFETNSRMHVLEGGTNALDPLDGVYEYKATLSAATDRWAIDGHPFDFKGESYFVWSGWEGTHNVGQNLYIAKLSNPYTISGDRVEISKPEFAWEKVGFPPVNEGPTSFIDGNTVNIIYSASASWTNKYCLGRITNTDGNLLSKSSWTKVGPVFSSSFNVYGPGHASFVKSPDSIQWWIVFHVANYDGSGLDRRIMAQQFVVEDGVPYFGSPIEPGTPIAAPSTGPAESSPLKDGWYRIKSKESSLFIDLPGNTKSCCVIIQQYTENGSDAQKWKFTYLGEGFYKITAFTSGLVLDNVYGGRDGESAITVYKDKGTWEQQWRVQDFGNGFFKLINRRNLLALNVPRSTHAVGWRLDQWYQNTQDAELWQITSV